MRYVLFLLTLLVLSCNPRKPTPEQLNPGDEGTLNWSPVYQDAPERTLCSDGKVAVVLEPPTERPSVVIDCHLVLGPTDVVTKKLLFLGDTSSGASVECNGATINHPDGDAIEIRSRFTNPGWVPVHDITIRGCTVHGGIRVWGMGINGEGQHLHDSSRTLNHVTTVRNNAPYRITLDQLTVVANGRIPVYLSPGVHSSALTNSIIQGSSSSVAIYLDAESHGNLIDWNIIEAGVGREVIALDGSSYNIVSDNVIAAPDGGIFLYRNCGEAGNIRHATPSYNVIEDNEIICTGWLFNSHVGVYLGARDGNRGYCDEDAGWPFGSSISDYDHARFNTISGNNLHDCTIETGNRSNHSNTIE
jgi:hypothetical protein